MKKVYIQLSTHWDREWYNPFQAFRYELIGVTDKIISEVRSKKNIESFVFDGQTIVTEDYLEIVPEKRCELAKQIENGSIKIGPWYVMPDEWLVSGESLIRNFQQGKRICNDFNTEPFRYGYINDIFGHIAQFPQLLNKLGIKMAYLGRGMGADENTFRNFVWKAPDGSKCFGYKYNYSAAYRKYLRFISSGDKSESEKDEYVKNYIESELEKSGCGVILLNVTDDHANLSDEMLDFTARVKRLDGIELIFDGFDKAYNDIAAAEKELPEFCGELIQTAQSGDMRVVTDSISSYYPLKEYNDRCQAMLENEVSPITVYGNLNGVPIRKEFLRAAYKELLKTHPHDNICGCSADQVHKDMYYRFDQVREIADAVKRDFTYKTGRTAYKKGRNYLLEIFNPAPYKRKQVITADIDFDKQSELRITAGLEYVLRKNLLNGHTCLPRTKLLEVASRLLECSPDTAENACDRLIECFRIKEKNVMGVEYLSIPAYYSAEEHIAARLLAVKRYIDRSITADALEIDNVERQLGIKFEELQRKAITEAFESGILVLTGGPGTGKTTTLNAIIKLFENRGLEPELAAPTGRAAKRMTELTGREAKTIHRLLEVEWTDGDRQQFSRNEKNPLSCEVIIIDEASMIDALLFDNLLKALRLSCRIILVGDSDQLPSIGAGNVLGDILASDMFPSIRLNKVFRQASKSMIITNAHAIINGEPPDFSNKNSDCFFLKRTSRADVSRTVTELVSEAARRL